MARIRLSTPARKAYVRVARSDGRLFARVDRALDRIAAEPAAGKPLVGPLAGRRSYRVGAIRIVYRLRGGACEVLVLAISPRGAAYR